MQWAGKEMKGDRELCMAAVAQNWRAIKFCAGSIKRDEEIVLAAWKRAR